MIRYYYHRGHKSPLALVYVRESLQFREKIRVLKPTGNSLLSPGVLSLGHEITGCLSLRLNRETLAELLLVITGQTTASAPVSQSEGLFFHDLESSDQVLEPLGLIRSNKESISLLEDLILKSFTLSSERWAPVILKLELEGIQPQPWSFGKEGAPSIPDQSFLSLAGDEVSVDGEILDDLAAFSLKGIFTEEMKSHELMIRRKDQFHNDYSPMRKRISVRLILRCRESYEEGQPVRCEITVDEAIYRGEESFPDNKGIWGREFRYTLTGPLKIRVFTHLDDREVLL